MADQQRKPYAPAAKLSNSIQMRREHSRLRQVLEEVQLKESEADYQRRLRSFHIPPVLPRREPITGEIHIEAETEGVEVVALDSPLGTLYRDINLLIGPQHQERRNFPRFIEMSTINYLLCGHIWIDREMHIKDLTGAEIAVVKFRENTHLHDNEFRKI